MGTRHGEMPCRHVMGTRHRDTNGATHGDSRAPTGSAGLPPETLRAPWVGSGAPPPPGSGDPRTLREGLKGWGGFGGSGPSRGRSRAAPPRSRPPLLYRRRHRFRRRGTAGAAGSAGRAAPGCDGAAAPLRRAAAPGGLGTPRGPGGCRGGGAAPGPPLPPPPPPPRPWRRGRRTAGGSWRGARRGASCPSPCPSATAPTRCWRPGRESGPPSWGRSGAAREWLSKTIGSTTCYKTSPKRPLPACKCPPLGRDFLLSEVIGQNPSGAGVRTSGSESPQSTAKLTPTNKNKKKSRTKTSSSSSPPPFQPLLNAPRCCSAVGPPHGGPDPLFSGGGTQAKVPFPALRSFWFFI